MPGVEGLKRRKIAHPDFSDEFDIYRGVVPVLHAAILTILRSAAKEWIQKKGQHTKENTKKTMTMTTTMDDHNKKGSVGIINSVVSLIFLSQCTLEAVNCLKHPMPYNIITS